MTYEPTKEDIARLKRHLRFPGCMKPPNDELPFDTRLTKLKLKTRTAMIEKTLIALLLIAAIFFTCAGYFIEDLQAFIIGQTLLNILIIRGLPGKKDSGARDE